MNKFSIGEKVVVTGKEGIGTVKTIKKTEFINEDLNVSTSYEYLVQVGESWNKKWYQESNLSYYLNDEISVNKVLINVNLLHNLEFAKQLKYENDKLEIKKNAKS